MKTARCGCEGFGGRAGFSRPTIGNIRGFDWRAASDWAG